MTRPSSPEARSMKFYSAKCDKVNVCAQKQQWTQQQTPTDKWLISFQL